MRTSLEKNGIWLTAWGELVLTALLTRPPLPVDETRYLSVAWEMWQQQHILVPISNGAPYSHKPPLLFWLMQASWLPFGVHGFTARLIAPLFGLGSIWLSMRLAAKLWPERPVLPSRVPFLLLGMPVWTVYASLTMFDTLVAFFSLLGWLALINAAQTNRPAWWWVFGLAIGLGLLSKGPVALVFLLWPALLAPWWLRRGTLEAAADFLALGLDPDRCIFWVQSDVPEVCELTWLLSIVTPMGLLERCHSYKDKVAKSIPASHGLFSYPVLMAADILLYQPHLVPVGKDQKQHIEVTRDIAIRFNNTFGETFLVPDGEISENTAVIPGLDGQKMSKSYDNTIPIFADEKELRKKVMAIQTDATPVEAPKNPDTCNLYTLLKLFAPEDKMAEVHELYVNGGAAYGYLKQDLFELINARFAPARKRKQELLDNPDYVRQVLAKGADKAREKAMKTLQLARERVGLKY